MANNRELSQLASLIVVDDTIRNIGIATTGFSKVGIGTTNPVGQLQVSSGPVIIGAATSTGTASQPLQVTGGAYIAGDTTNGVGLGIGVTNPVGPLHIRLNPSLSNTDSIRIQPTSATYAAAIRFANGSSAPFFTGLLNSVGSLGTISGLTPYAGFVGLQAGTTPLLFVTNGLERARIFDTGEVGIGTTVLTGTVSQPLQVTGGAYVSGSVGIGTTRPVTNLNVRVDQNDETSIRVNNNTDGVNAYSAVIAGNTLGGFVYQINANSRTNTRFGSSIGGFAEIYTSGSFTGSGIKFGTLTAHPVIIGTNDTEAMRIDSSQRVGIGTTNPVGQLQVSSGPVIIGAATSTGTSSQPLQVTGGAYVSGNLGIGTTNPAVKLQIFDDVNSAAASNVTNNNAGTSAYTQFSLSNDGSTLVLQNNALSRTVSRFGSAVGGWGELYLTTGNGLKVGTFSATPLVLGTNNTEAIRIDSSQRVGIGTTNPTSKLQVNGVISLGRTDNSGITSIRSVIDTISWEHAGVKKSVTTEDLNPQDLFFKDDGTKMFIVGSTGDRVYEYALGTAWDVSSAGFTTFFSVATQDTSPVGLFFRPNGLNMYVSGQTGVAPLFASGDYVHQYTLGTAWDISNAGAATVGWTTSFRVLEETNPFAVYFKDDGTKMFVAGNTNQRIYEYALGTAWNVSTAGLTTSILIGTGTTQNLPLTLTGPTGLAFNASGTQMFISDSDSDVVARFNLRTAWDLNTAVFYDNVYVGFQDLSSSGIFYQENQSKAYITGNGTDTVYQYNTNVPSLELESSGISTRSSVVVNNETRLNDRLYVTGDTHVSSNTTLKGTLTVDGASTLTGAVSIAGNLTVSGGTISAGNNTASLLTANTTTAVNFFTGQTSGAFTFGGTSGTGTITLGRATTSQQTDIQAGVTASGNTKTINLGTGGASGSFTRIAVGPSLGIGTVIINSGTNLGIGTSVPTSALHVTGDALITGITTSTDFNSSSDINLKDNIQRIENPIDKVLQLDGVTFNWKETNRPSVGVVAQQVEKVLPQLVSGDQTKTVNYNGLIALLIECVKEQQIEINNLKEKLK